MSDGAASVLWFRRDLRLADHPALTEAAAGGPVVALFVVDPLLWDRAGAPRRAFLAGCLRALDEAIGGRLVVRTGDPVDVVPAVAAEADAPAVFVSADFAPYGARRDDDVAAALDAAGRELHRVGSPYAVDPGDVRKPDGTPYRVFSPFAKAWRAHGWGDPVAAPAVEWVAGVDGGPVPDAPATAATLPPAGEAAALAALDAFVRERLPRYAEERNRPDLDSTSRLSPYLRWGCLHPRQVLARLGRDRASDVLRNELCWREFYADVLHHDPGSARRAWARDGAELPVDEGPDADERFAAWAEGRTGYPIVDAGMRQLLGEAWVHNRVRMIAASFLVKDLHLDWRRGARHFMQHLVDGDLPSNQHGWQWVAGTGTDPAVFTRVFNPTLQAEKFDPDGTYVRRWVPELADALPVGYPEPIVDHAEERIDALARWRELSGGRRGGGSPRRGRR